MSGEEGCDYVIGAKSVPIFILAWDAFLRSGFLQGLQRGTGNWVGNNVETYEFKKYDA